MRIITTVIALSPLLASCAMAPPAEPPPDRYVGLTKWVNPKFPVYVCSGPPSGPGSMGTGCKAAVAGTALTIKRALFVYKYDIPLPNGYEVADAAGTVGFIRDTDPIMMLDEAERKHQAEAKHDCDRRGGVAVGMTTAQVYASCWGKPKSINETTIASRNHEQLVYGGGYVYLDNGVVTSIQTSR
jgi:hypothetical protein